MTESYKQQLKTEWAKLRKGSGSTPDQRAAAKKEINKLEALAGFQVTDFEASDKAFAERKNSSPNPVSTSSTFSRLEFKVLEKVEKEALTQRVRRLFEIKNLIEQIAHDEFPQYENGASVGQVLGILEGQQ